MSTVGLRRRVPNTKRPFTVRMEKTTRKHVALAQPGPAAVSPKFQPPEAVPNSATRLDNFVDFLCNNDIPIYASLSVDDEEFIGRGSTMDVYAATWQEKRVALKRLKPERKPRRAMHLAPAQDVRFRVQSRAFNADVQGIIQEVRVMAKVSLFSSCVFVYLGYSIVF